MCWNSSTIFTTTDIFKQHARIKFCIKISKSATKIPKIIIRWHSNFKANQMLGQDEKHWKWPITMENLENCEPHLQKEWLLNNLSSVSDICSGITYRFCQDIPHRTPENVAKFAPISALNILIKSSWTCSILVFLKIQLKVCSFKTVNEIKTITGSIWWLSKRQLPQCFQCAESLNMLPKGRVDFLNIITSCNPWGSLHVLQL